MFFFQVIGVAQIINKKSGKHQFTQKDEEVWLLLGTLSKDVFERRTLTGSEAFSLFICLDANKFVLLSFFSLIKTIYLRVSTEPLPNDAITPLPVDVRRSKTLLLKLPIVVVVVRLFWYVFPVPLACPRLRGSWAR